jgi:hypothetical protein
MRRNATFRIIGDGKGSGTLIATKKLSDGRTLGVILTCAHVYRPRPVEQLKKPRAHFHKGELREGNILAVNWDNDLCVMAFFVPEEAIPRKIAAEYVKGGTGNLYVCGYGPNGTYVCHAGPVVGYNSMSWSGSDTKEVPADPLHPYVSSGKNQVYIRSAGNRRGDSGGGMFTSSGELAGVFWGGRGPHTYGTFSGTIRQFLIKKMPEEYSWAVEMCCDHRRSRPRTPQPPPVDLRPPVVTRPTPTPTPSQPQPRPKEPMPPMNPPPMQPPVAQDDHQELKDGIEQLKKRLDELAEHHEMIAGGIAGTPTKEDFAALVTRVEELGKKMEAGGGSGEVVIRMEPAGRFISPSYVDVSLLWALQQQSGVDHFVLIVDTGDATWERMSSEYETAKQAFPAIDLYDVASKGVKLKSLPQLVVVPVSGGEPTILYGTDAVSKKLQALSRGEF